jgi:carbon-monoxide dehydrogenase large subunit
MTPEYVGRPVPRVDALDKVTGSAVYAVDVELPGMLHAAVLRSPRPHARIVAIDVSEAGSAPGVRAAVTGKDFPRLFGPMIKDQPFLAIDRVRYVGEPVAAVAADTAALAQAALDRIVVHYEDVPAVFDPRQAVLPDAPLVHERLDAYVRSPRYDIVPGTNICTVRTYALGSVERGFADADEIFDDEFSVHAVAHSPMETHAAVVRYSRAKEEVTVWSSTDAPYRRARELADALGLSANQVRFISTYSGGGFGGKGAMVAEAIGVVLARVTMGRPVKVVYSREEELTASQTRLAAWVRLRTGVKKDGTFTARKADILWDSGAYASKGPEVSARGALTVFGPYRIPNLELLSRLVYTNREIGGAYRGFGTTQVTWACEVQMDIIARKLGMDPLEMRLKNGYGEGDRYINGQLLRGVGLGETLERAAREIGWGQPKPAAGDGKARGRGMATLIKGTNTPTDSYCFIKVNDDASVTLLSSTVEIGAGQKTVLAQIAAEAIGVPVSWIAVPNPDTATTPYDFGVTSSRSTYHMGNAVRLAGEDVRRKILDLAGSVLHVEPGRLSIVGGKISEEGVGVRITLKALLAKQYGGKGGAILGEGHFTPAGSSVLDASPGPREMSSIFWMFATHAAEVEVDTETGVVKVIKIAAAHDVGRAVNPIGCEQQIQGAVVMGVSNALFEEFKSENGRVLNDTLADYKLATMMDFPEIVPIIVESTQQEGPFGAKGVGEPAVAPTAPAIANAIFDAVGIRIKELPITPEKILAALGEVQAFSGQ